MLRALNKHILSKGNKNGEVSCNRGEQLQILDVDKSTDRLLVRKETNGSGHTTMEEGWLPGHILGKAYIK